MTHYWPEAVEENRRLARLGGRSFHVDFLAFIDDKYGPFPSGYGLLNRAEEYADEQQAMEDVEPPELSGGPVWV